MILPPLVSATGKMCMLDPGLQTVQSMYNSKHEFKLQSPPKSQALKRLEGSSLEA
jgi:hypothetical protein